MSLEAIKLTWDTRNLTPSEKLVLLYISNVVSEQYEYEFFQKLQKIADSTGLHISTIKDIMKHLIELGYLSNTGKKQGQNKRIIVYKLNVDFIKQEAQNQSEFDKKNIKKSTDEPIENFGDGRHRRRTSSPQTTIDRRPGRLSLYIRNNSNLEQEKNTKHCASGNAPEEDKSFDEFWKAYPVRKNKQKAKQLWQKNKCYKLLEQILTAIKNFQSNDKDWLRGAIPHPTTFINQKRWEDEIMPIPHDESNAANNSEFPPGYIDFERGIEVLSDGTITRF